MKESQKCGSLHLPIPSAAPRAAPFTKQISHAAGSTRTSPKKPALKASSDKGKNSKRDKKAKFPRPLLLPARLLGSGTQRCWFSPGWDLRVPSCHRCFGVPIGVGDPRTQRLGGEGCGPPGSPMDHNFLGYPRSRVPRARPHPAGQCLSPHHSGTGIVHTSHGTPSITAEPPGHVLVTSRK